MDYIDVLYGLLALAIISGLVVLSLYLSGVPLVPKGASNDDWGPNKFKFLVTDPSGNLSAYGLTSESTLVADANGNLTVQPNKGYTSTLNINTNGDKPDDNSFQIGNTTDGKMTIKPRNGNNWDNSKLVTFDKNGILKINNSSGSTDILGGGGGEIAGHVGFFKANGERKGYIGWGGGANNKYLELGVDTSANGWRINSGKEFCIGSTCINENDLIKLKNNTFPKIIINGDDPYPITINDKADKTSLIRFNSTRAFGLDGNNNLWNNTGWYYS